MSSARGKIELVYNSKSSKPEIKFFGSIRPRDINSLNLLVSKAWRRYNLLEGKRRKAMKEEAEAEAEKVVKIEAKRLEEQANKEKKNESGTDKPTESKSGSTEAGSSGSRIDKG